MIEKSRCFVKLHILDFCPCAAVDRFDICLQLCPLSETGRSCLEEERGKQE